MKLARLAIPVVRPFSFAQTLAFARRFPPLERVAIVTGDALTAALSAGGRAWAFTLREDVAQGGLVADLDDRAPRSLAVRIGDLVGAGDDLAPFYRAADGDVTFAPVIDNSRGLHQVRFLGIEEVAAYVTMMQRTPIAMAVRMKRAFLDAFGHPVDVAGPDGARTLRAMPELPELAALDPADIARAINHPAKAERISTIVRGVAALGEDFLRTAPYDQARDALLAIPGVGPFSAGAILLRGLGRMDDLPSLAMFEREGRAVYGGRWNERAIAARYAGVLGYWAYYLKAQARPEIARTLPARAPRRATPKARRVGLSFAHD